MRGFSYRWRAGSAALSVADHRRRAARVLPAMVWAYLEGGADDEVTCRANRSAFARRQLHQRVLRGTSNAGLGTTVAGVELALPILLAPTGLSGLIHWTGEPAAARAAEAAGIRAVLSTAASYTPEEVAAATREAHLFQLYPWRGSGRDPHTFTRSVLDRVRAAGFHALVVTVDSSTYGNRERERHAGMGLPPVLTPARILDAGRRPRWWLAALRHRRLGLRILEDDPSFAGAVRSASLHQQLLRPDLSWDDLAWVRDHWTGPLLVKGIMHPDDAARAVDIGADGIVVSNHGGRQLDGVPASLDALPAVAERVGNRAEVLLDGGIGRGSDIVKARCLGARAVLLGRAHLYGLASGGQAGVEDVLRILREEMVRTMTLMGVHHVDELGPQWLVRESF